MKKIDARHLSPEALNDLRRRAVAAVDAGSSQTDVASMLGLPRQTVSRWWLAFLKGGDAGLTSKPRGRRKGDGAKLLPWQEAQIAQTLRDRRPEQLKLPFYLWTRDAVVDLIDRRYNVVVSRWTAGRYLKRWGFTPQRPVRRAWEQSSPAVKKWIEEEYPAVHAQAKTENALIFWGDEMGLRSDHHSGRSWSPRGQTPVIEGTGQRFGCNMISAITNRGELSFMVFRENFTVAIFLKFLRRLIRQQKGRKFYLIVDGHPVHRAKLVQRWLQKHEDEVRLVRLPAYSPELNPDEMLNQDVKTNALGRQRPANAPDLIRRVRSYLRRRQRQPHIVRGYFYEKHVQYAAAQYI